MLDQVCTRLHEGIKKIDLFGQPIELNYRLQDRFQTVFGGFITIIMALVLCLFFQKNITRFLNKDQIVVSQEQIYDNNPPNLELHFDNYMFAIQVTQDNFVTKPLFEIALETRHYHRLENGTTVRNNMEPCTLSHWADISNDFDWEATYNKLNFKDWLCPKKNQTITLGGVYISTDFHFVKISVNKCNNNKVKKQYGDQAICATDAEIQSVLDQRGGTAVISIYQSNKIINPQKKFAVSSYLSEETFFNFQPKKLYTKADIFFQKVALETDQSLMPTEDIEYLEYGKFEPKDFREQYEAGSEDQYAVFYFRRSPFTNIFTRSFQKVDDLISYIGGFFQTLLMVLAFIVGYYNQWIFIVDIANRLYNFKQKEKKLTFLKRQEEMKKYLVEQEGRASQQNKLSAPNQKAGQRDTQNYRSSQSSNLRDSSKKSSLRAEDIRNIIKQRSKTIKMSFNQSLKNRGQFKIPNYEQEDAQSKVSQKSEIISPLKFEGSDIKNKIQQNLPIIQESDNDCGSQRIIKTTQEMQLVKTSNFQKEQYPQNTDQLDLTGDIAINFESKNKEIHQRRQSNLFQQQNYTIEEGLYQVANFNKMTNDKDSFMNLNTNRFNGIEIEHQKDTKPSTSQFNLKNGDDYSFTVKQQSPFNLQELDYSNEKHNVQHNNSPKSAVVEESEKIVQGFQFKSRKSFLIQQFEDILQRQKGIVLGTKFFINKLFFGMLFQSDENDLIEKAAELVSKDLDIYEILSKLQEVEKIKRVIFDQQQLILFNFFPKPLIGEDNDEELINRENLMKKYQLKQKKSNSNIQQKPMPVKSGRVAANALRAISRMKRGIIKQRGSFSDIKAYKKLYEAYEYIVEDKAQNNIQINKRLVKLLGKEMDDIFSTSKLLNFKEDIDDDNENQLKDQRRVGIMQQVKPRKNFLRGKTFQEVIIKKANEKEIDEDDDDDDQASEIKDINEQQQDEQEQASQRNISNDNINYNNNKNTNNHFNDNHISNIGINIQQLQNQIYDKHYNKQNNKNLQKDLNDSSSNEVPQEVSDEQKQKVTIKYENHRMFDQHILGKSTPGIFLNINKE